MKFNKFSKHLELPKAVFNSWLDHRAPQLGAALAYYSIFSLGPLLILAIALAGLVFGDEAASGELFAQLAGLIGEDGAAAVSTLVNAADRPIQASWASAAAFGALAFGATGVIVQLKDALNLVWSVQPKPGHTLRTFAKKYLLSLATVMGFGFLLMVSLIASTVVAALGKYVAAWLPASETLLQLSNFGISFVIFTAMIGAMNKYLPDVKLRMRDVLPGAALTTLLFMLGKTLIGLYLGRQSIGSTYGAAGSVVVILIWIYYSAQIFFFGAEFTQVYCRRRGVAVKAEPGAEIVRTDRFEKQPPRGPLSQPLTQP